MLEQNNPSFTIRNRECFKSKNDDQDFLNLSGMTQCYLKLDPFIGYSQRRAV